MIGLIARLHAPPIHEKNAAMNRYTIVSSSRRGSADKSTGPGDVTASCVGRNENIQSIVGSTVAIR